MMKREKNLPPRVTYAQHHEAMALKRRREKGMSYQSVRSWWYAHRIEILAGEAENALNYYTWQEINAK